MVDFIGIGTQKAGTTWLWEMLRQHPDIAFPPFKEVHYFDVLYLGMPRDRRLRVIDRAIAAAVENLVGGDEARGAGAARLQRIADPSRAFTDEWYRSLFEGNPAGAVTGEITPYYCGLPEAGIEHVARLAPSARLIYLIRDPVQRGVSSLRQMSRQWRTPDMLLNSEEYFRRGDYRSNIARWERIFPADQILYVPFGDIRREPLAVLRSVERHIGVQPLDRYEGTDTVYGATGSKELVVTEAMIHRVSEVFSGQLDYLTERFGTGFVSRIV